MCKTQNLHAALSQTVQLYKAHTLQWVCLHALIFFSWNESNLITDAKSIVYICPKLAVHFKYYSFHVHYICWECNFATLTSKISENTCQNIRKTMCLYITHLKMINKAVRFKVLYDLYEFNIYTTHFSLIQIKLNWIIRGILHQVLLVCDPSMWLLTDYSGACKCCQSIAFWWQSIKAAFLNMNCEFEFGLWWEWGNNDFF